MLQLVKIAVHSTASLKLTNCIITIVAAPEVCFYWGTRGAL